MPEVVNDGVVTFRVNGRGRADRAVDALPEGADPVDPADVIADGTIGLTMTTEGPTRRAGLRPGGRGRHAPQDRARLPRRGDRAHDGRPTSSRPLRRDHVVIPEDADPELLAAGVAAVAALAYRYDDAPIDLSLTVPAAETASASQRVVALVAGRRARSRPRCRRRRASRCSR